MAKKKTETAPEAAPQAENPAYQVLQLKYRPQTFDDVAGQDNVVRNLHNDIRDNRVGHAYLFCGPRGVGKTSMARIFAKALNCKEGPTTKPCGKCVHCVGIARDADMDVIEVDAATYTQKDETTRLLEGIDRSSFSARYKVYIIDEVHMFSTHSFNVLLKRLEEPPPKVVFILATTNPEKIPETVISRCRKLEFERVEVRAIVDRLKLIAEKEGVEFEEGEEERILEAIALASDGGMRDSQVAFDQLISLSEGKVTMDAARRLLGIVESDMLHELLDALIERNVGRCLSQIHEMVERGRDLHRFVQTFLAFLRDGMLIKADAPVEMLKVCRAQPDRLREQVQKLSMPALLNMVQQFLELDERMRGAAPARFLMEFTLMKLAAIDPRFVLDALESGKATPDGGAAPSSTGNGPAKGSSGRATAGQTPAGAASGASVTASTGGHDPGAPQARRTAAAPMLSRSGGGAMAATIEVGDVEEIEEMGVSEPSPAIEAIPTTEEDRVRGFIDQIGRIKPGYMDILSHASIRKTDEGLVIELDPLDRASEPNFQRSEWSNLLRDAATEIWGRPLKPMVTCRIETVNVDTEEIQEIELVSEMPVREPSRKENAKPEPDKKESSLTLDSVLDKYPDLREKMLLIEQHLNLTPTHLNGKRL